MKLTILGGGGFRTPLVYEAVAKRVTGLEIDQVSLHDVDTTRLGVMQKVTAQMAEQIPHAPAVHATTDLTEALADADFIFCAIRVGGAEQRTVDERVALELGLLGQETIGPGGLAYALRTIPVMTEVATAIDQQAPNAWVINFTNPAGIVTEAMQRVLGERVVGICDTPIGLVRRVARALQLEMAEVDYDYVGLNHLGWLRGVHVDGVDRLPELLADDALLDQIEEARIIGTDYVRQMGVLPNEYLYYYLHTAQAIARVTKAGQTRGEFLLAQQGDFYRGAEHADDALQAWRDALHEREATYMAEGRDEERREEDIAGGGYQEVALRLMTALATGTQERMILNVANGALIPQLPADVAVEVPCRVDGDGIHALPVAPLTLEQLGRMSRLRAAERCILAAALGRDAGAAWEGFSIHPLVDSPELGQKLLAGYRERSPEIGQLLG